MFFLASIAYFFWAYTQTQGMALSEQSLKGYVVFCALWFGVRLMGSLLLFIFTRGLRSGPLSYLLRLAIKTIFAALCIYLAFYSWRYF